ncbi:MAG: hypothetical protein ABI678_17200 [Kofleriaceae bacterium]
MKRPGRTIALTITIVCAIVGAAASITPSMAFRSKSGVIQYTYALSLVFAPALWAVMAIAAGRALRMPTAGRLRLVAAVTFVALAVFMGIKWLRKPWFDIDGQFVIVSQRTMDAYLVCVAVAAVVALYLAVMAKRIAVVPSTVPRASMLSDNALSQTR